MILQMPHSFRWGDRAWVVRSKTLAESVNGRCQRLACYVPKSRGERQIRHFSSAFILMYAVSFIIYMTVWLTLLCVLFDFYWIHIKICGESVPLHPERTEKICKEPGGPYQIGKVLRALFSPRKVYSKLLHETTKEKVSKWKKEVCIMCADHQSESELIHYLGCQHRRGLSQGAVSAGVHIWVWPQPKVCNHPGAGWRSSRATLSAGRRIWSCGHRWQTARKLPAVFTPMHLTRTNARRRRNSERRLVYDEENQINQSKQKHYAESACSLLLPWKSAWA